jgi:hypothetical protein
MFQHIRSRRFNLVNWLLLAAMPLSYALSLVLPPNWGEENGPIENTQVAVLLFGCGAALVAWRRQRGLPTATLALSATPIWLILAARELSWGAVLMEGNPELWYQPVVAPLICAGLASSLVLVWRSHLRGFLSQLVWRDYAAVFPIVLAAAASYFSACAEKHVVCGIPLDPLHAEVWEEALELLAYIALVHAQHLVLRACRAYVAQAERAVLKGHDVVG